MSDRIVRAADSVSLDRWEEIGHELKADSAALHGLSLTGRQVLGSAVEPLVRTLHEQLDELVELWRELGDHLAEQAQFAAGAEH